jgi:hypothetical protein
VLANCRRTLASSAGLAMLGARGGIEALAGRCKVRSLALLLVGAVAAPRCCTRSTHRRASARRCS